MKPTEVLVTEHNAILLSLQILDKAADRLASGDAKVQGHLEQLIDFYRGFVDQCHHAKEEDVLFPELEKRGLSKEGGPIGVMLAEHESGRRCIREISSDLTRLKKGNGEIKNSIRKNASAYDELLREHITKENNVLFPLADRLLPETEAAIMIEKFEEIERDRVGPGKHEAFHDMLHRMREIYKV